MGRPRLAREHRLDRRPVRHRRADEHRPHPDDGSGGPQRPARRRADPHATRSSTSRSRRPSRACRPRCSTRERRGRTRLPTTPRREARPDVRRELRGVRRRRPAVGPRRRGRRSIEDERSWISSWPGPARAEPGSATLRSARARDEPRVWRTGEHARRDRDQGDEVGSRIVERRRMIDRLERPAPNRRDAATT